MMITVNTNKRKIEAIYPLSPMQEGMLFHSLYSPQSGIYINQLSCQLHGDVKLDVFREVWQQAIARHAALRTLFLWEDRKKPLQVVVPDAPLPWIEQDWRQLDQRRQKAELETFLSADRAKGFPLDQPPLMRAALIHLSENTYQFIWSFHHIIIDGWCIPLILSEVFQNYRALCQSRPVRQERSKPYRDYIIWLRKQDMEKAETFWKQKLKGFEEKTLLNAEQTAPGEWRFAEQKAQLSPELTGSLQDLAKQEHLTLATIIQGAWVLLLCQYGQKEDIIFGSTVSGRSPEIAGVQNMVGLFINTLPIRVHCPKDDRLTGWFKEIQRQQVEAEQYSYTPLVEIQKWGGCAPGSPLFESIVVFENYPVDESLRNYDMGFQIRDVRHTESTNFPLNLVVASGETIQLKIAYQENYFCADTIRRMLGHLEHLLSGMIKNPAAKLSGLSLMSDKERQQVLVDFNDTRREYANDRCLHELFEDQVKRSPHSTALLFEGEPLTYQELNDKADALACYLRSLGTKEEDLIGICVERSFDMIVGLLGILKAGGAYVPLDPAYPQERLAFMLEDAKVPVLLTQQHLLDRLPEHDAKTVCLDEPIPCINGGIAQGNLNREGMADHLAYCIYTSGSTGKPKGALITHRAIVNRLLWMQDEYPLKPGDPVMHKTPFSFDVSVWELFWPIITGAVMVIAKPEGHKDGDYLRDLIVEQNITTMHFVPSMLRAFLEVKDLGQITSLKNVICSGEALSRELQDRFFEKVDARLHNLYGPTEAAVDVTSWRCEKGSPLRSVPIGRPIANIQIYILDKDQQPVPVGIPGELYIGGVGVGRGYLNRPELTEEKFMPNPFASGRLYRTGDMARYLPDGNIEFLGRIDHQVKIRGFRIELGEIETALQQHPDVQDAVVVARADHQGNQELVAYVATRPEKISVNQLRHYVQKSLPDYMVPAFFMVLDKLPLTPNGKADRKALPKPERVRPELTIPFVAPRNDVEQQLAGIWEEVLEIKKVGIHDNFFEIGGHSLLAIQIISRVENVFKIKVPLYNLFQEPTIAVLAAFIEEEKQNGPRLQTAPIVPLNREARQVTVTPEGEVVEVNE